VNREQGTCIDVAFLPPVKARVRDDDLDSADEQRKKTQRGNPVGDPHRSRMSNRRSRNRPSRSGGGRSKIEDVCRIGHSFCNLLLPRGVKDDLFDQLPQPLGNPLNEPLRCNCFKPKAAAAHRQTVVHPLDLKFRRSSKQLKDSKSRGLTLFTCAFLRSRISLLDGLFEASVFRELACVPWFSTAGFKIMRLFRTSVYQYSAVILTI
jgi:hypothetical protein